MRFFSLIAASAVMILCGCGSGRESDRTAIAVSFEPQAWILERIAGDDVEVLTLLPSGTDPENYQPSISTMKGLANASVYLSLGTPGFEESLEERLASNMPDLKIEDCSKGIEKITDTHSFSSTGHSGHIHRKDFDPHYLSSVKNCMVITANIAETLQKIYPENAEKYRRSAENLLQELSAIDDSISGMNLADKSFVIRHPSLSYFARDYGLNQLSLQKDSKEVSPIQLKNNLEAISSHRPSVFVVEKEHASSSDKETASQLGTQVTEISLNSPQWLNDLIRLANEIDRH